MCPLHLVQAMQLQCEYELKLVYFSQRPQISSLSLNSHGLYRHQPSLVQQLLPIHMQGSVHQYPLCRLYVCHLQLKFDYHHKLPSSFPAAVFQPAMKPLRLRLLVNLHQNTLPICHDQKYRLYFVGLTILFHIQQPLPFQHRWQRLGQVDRQLSQLLMYVHTQDDREFQHLMFENFLGLQAQCRNQIGKVVYIGLKKNVRKKV